MRILKRCCLFLAILVQGILLRGQVTNLGGVVNTYLDVSAVDLVNNALTLSSTSGMVVGDTVFIIQMQGITMNTTNTASFGDISSINGGGGYEFNIICGISGNVITLERLLTQSYDPAGGLQVIPVESYRNVNINAVASPQAWDGNLGGVMVIAAPSGWVKLSANIDARDKGFRGGNMQDLVSGCSCANYATQYTDYFYPIANWRGALKGEGAAAITVGMEAGKGKQVNGGGGANDHNAGGAGGGNFGGGGLGGNAAASSCFFGSYCRGLNPGIGGLGFGTTYYTATGGRLFMGGGGGAGDYGNSAVGAGSPGGYGVRGAGIVVIWADSIDGNGFSVLANGTTVPYLSAADGGGGGGAGGTVMLDARAFSPSSLTVNVAGGNGANHSWSAGANNCKGTGGGGGGGVVYMRVPSNPPVVSINAAGGIAGIQGGTSCAALGNAGATNGAAGGIVNNMVRVFASAAYPPCVLPVVFSSFSATSDGLGSVLLDWETSVEYDNQMFEVHRSWDGLAFEEIGSVNSHAANGMGAAYHFVDEHPVAGTIWYRIRQVDADGRGMFSEVRMVRFDPGSLAGIRELYPNPAKAPGTVTMEAVMPQSATVEVAFLDMLGRVVERRSVHLEEGLTSVELSIDGLDPGIYFVRLDAGVFGKVVKKLQVKD